MKTLTRLLFIFLLLAMATVAVSAKSKRSKGNAKPAASKSAETPFPPKIEELWPPAIPLKQNLRFTVRPTLLGLVPPGDPLGYGECFVRVLSADPLLVHYEIKEQHTEPVGTSRSQDVTTIRRGEIGVMRTEPKLDPPVLWRNGSWQASGGLLWLRQQDFAELKEGGRTLLDLRIAPRDGDPLSSALSRLIAQRREQYGLSANDLTGLVVQDWQASYPAYVNGRRADLPAIRCTDSVRLAMYWILDDAENPLLLKMTYIAPSLAESEPPAPAQKPEQASQRTVEQESLQAPPQAVQDPAEALIESGAGFAVINIDF